MKKKIIYMDNASTTKVYPEAVDEMKRAMLEEYGNPSSAHELGENALKLINEARKKLADEIGAKLWGIVFTSCATESNNLALFGIANSEIGKEKKKIIISSIEHASVFEPAMELRKKGFSVVEISVDKEGFIDFEQLEKEIDDKTLVVSVIHGNNEIGTLQDLEKIGYICRKRGVIFHTDAAQSFGKEKIDVKKMNIGMLSASGHKIGGPKGIGFLFIREGIGITSVLLGGGQEKGIRSGTENVPAVIGFAKALEMIKKKNSEGMKEIRDYFISEIEKIDGKINGSRDKRLANNVSARFECDAGMLLAYLSQNGIMCSTGSACNEKSEKENRILGAIGLNKKEIEGTIRFSIGFDTSKKDIDFTVGKIKEFLEIGR